MLGSMHFG